MEEIKNKLKLIKEKFNIEEKIKIIRELESESYNPNFWQNNVEASRKMKELASLQNQVKELEEAESLLDNGQEDSARKIIKNLELLLYLSGPYDKNDAIFSIHAGQGGVDAMDWATILLRMYLRFFDLKGWRYEIINEAQGEEAGIKSATVFIKGDFAYGYLKKEQGVHRLVRLSPFNADKLRHTSFALVEVLPQLENVELNIRESDLEWEFYRASSHGGQNVQKVSTAVRLKHTPSGIVVTCQTERGQAQNRESALQLLKVKLWVREEEERRQREKNIQGEIASPSWGNQIRSYVLHPYKLIKDLRTQVETGDTEKVLNGDLTEFIEAELIKI